MSKAGHETRAERQTFNLSSEYNLIILHETQSIASIATQLMLSIKEVHIKNCI
jgi:hypothetical protein